MMQFINDHTVRLVPDGQKRRTYKRPKKALNWLEREMVSAVKSAVQKQMQGQIFYERQVALSDRYHAALEKRDHTKGAGLPGFTSVPVACKVVRPR